MVIWIQMLQFYINIQKMQRKLYISNLDSPLGYHIAQFFREDHLQVNSSLRIVGSSAYPDPINGVHTQIDFTKYPQLACRTALDCDTVVLDLRSNSHQAEVILRFLQHAVDKSCKRIRVIGLSSLLTWEGMKAYQLQSQSSDKQAMMGNILDESKWRPLIYSDSDYPKRIPGHFSSKCYELQNLLLRLNQKENVRASVAAFGVLYGKENSHLQSQIMNALANHSLNIWGNGNNPIPLLHIETFLQAISTLIESKAHYSVLVDNRSYSQQQIKEFILKATGSRAEFKKKEPLFIVEEENIWTFPLLFKPSKQVEVHSRKRNFQNYCLNHLLEDLCQYTDWKPSQYIILNDKVDAQTVEAVVKQFEPRLQIISQQQIERLNHQLTSMHHPPEPEQTKKPSKPQKVQQPEVIPEYYGQAIQSLLKHRKYHNFLIKCSSKMKQYLAEAYFYSKLNQFVKIPQDKPHYSQILIDSQQYCALLGLQPIAEEKSVVQVVETAEIEKKAVYSMSKSLKKDEKMVLTTQYLMDNVLVAVSEAKFNMKSKGKETLSGLIDELKSIWARGNYRSCFDQYKKKEYFGQLIH